ncbi:MAG: hypothetical protein ABJ004_12390 [Cyclobacteriaceae bacterium]
MSVNPSISLNKVKEELVRCNEYVEKYSWLITELDESNQAFTVQMTSPLDNETYILEVIYSDYPELPLILEFVDPETGQRGTKHAYPKGCDSFFHGAPCICNPASRKSYKEFNPSGPHKPDKDWQLAGWKKHPKVGTLTTIDSILKAIYLRISDDRFYQRKRME